MGEAPTFFLPAASFDIAEVKYAELAKLCGRSVPSPEKRIYSITFTHNGTEWIATVGQPLQGIRRRRIRYHGKWTERSERISDPAIVWAIFPGNPYIVVTNYRFEENVRSAWENPFYAGQPSSITYFSIPKA